VAAGSSTLPNNDTITLKLPTGEMVDAIVPAGLSDDQVKSYVRMKRPDLFGAPAGVRNTISDPINQYDQEHSPAAGVAAMPGASPNLRPASNAEVGLGAAGLGAGALATYGPMVAGTALPFLRNQAQKHPIIATMAAQQAIHEARQIPGVGRFIPSAAEWLPFLIPGMGKGKPGIGGEPDATLDPRNIPENAGEDLGPTGAPTYRDATGSRNTPPYAGEDFGTAPVTPRPQPPTPPTAGRAQPTVADEPAAEAAGAPAMYTRQPQAQTPTPYAWQKSVPFLRNFGDVQNDQAVTQEMQQDLDAQQARVDAEQAREFAARNVAGTPKGILQQRAQAHIPQTSEDLMPLLKKSLDQARAKKKP
jgi:hypothetical protein